MPAWAHPTPSQLQGVARRMFACYAGRIGARVLGVRHPRVAPETSVWILISTKKHINLSGC